MPSPTITEIQESMRARIATLDDEKAALDGEREVLARAIKELASTNGNGATAPAAPEKPAAPAAPQPAAHKPATRRRGSGKYSDDAIIDIVSAHGEVGAGAIRERLGGSSNKLSMRLRKLVDDGVLIRTGERRSTVYRVAA